MRDTIKIGIGIASSEWGLIKIKTSFCITANVVEFIMGQSAFLAALPAQGCYVHWNREEIVEKARAECVTHIFFVDTDMIFAPDTLKKLFELRKDIAAARYNLRRREQTHSTVKVIEPDGTLADLWPDQMPKHPFCRILGRPILAPTGCMLIKTEALEKMAPPYFEAIRPMGEDLYFCKKAVAAGLEIWLDPTIEVGHIGDAIY